MFCSHSDHCRLVGFQPPKKDAKILHPYSCFREGIISTCPSQFSDWKLREHCEEGDNSWVYHTDKNGKLRTYRNSYCAVCNLGDEIRNASINRPQIELLSTSLRQAEQAFVNKTITAEKIIRARVFIDYSSDKCIFEGKEYRRGSTTDEDFNSNKSTQIDPFITFQRNMNINTSIIRLTEICRGVLGKQFAYSASLLGKIDEATFKPTYRYAQTPIERLFTYETLAISHHQTNNAEHWMNHTGRLQICSNSSFKDIISHNTYSQIKLSHQGIEVCNKVFVPS